MWSRIWLRLKSNFPLLLLLAVLGVVTWRNYPGTMSLFGWDSVQPELDFGINLRRALSSVWVGNQGVGHIGGHGYATILIQGLVEWVISLMVGVVQTRGVFIFSMLWLGPIGVYFLWKKWFGNTGKFASWGAMLSALFYLLNLGTAQVFYAPLEAFVIFYGLLPWAILSVVSYLGNSNKKNLVVLLIAQVLFSMIGFIPPQFIAYGMMILALLVGYTIEKRGDLMKALQKVLIVGAMLLVANMYWLVPIGYYSIYGSKSYVEAKNNQVSTPDFQYMSEARGKWSDVVLMRGFFIDSSDSVIKGEGKFFEIFEPWNNYLQGGVEWVGYSLFAILMLGLLMMLINRGRRSLGLSMILVLGIGWVAIAQAEEPFITIANLMRHVPVVGQAFRAAFTKFVGLLIFVYAIGFGYGIFAIYKLLRKKLIVGVSLVVIGVVSLIFYMWPMFRGNLIYERLKIRMPNEYVQIMKFFKSQDKSSRIVYLPSAWMWGWQVHEWGYSGSGFLWYAIEQPIIDRAFDVWSPFNEGYYNEFSNSLYQCHVATVTQCHEQVKQVLDKYDVRYVMLDESIISPGQSEDILRIPETKKLAEELGWEKVFSENFLSVWRVPSDTVSQFISAPSSYVWVEGDTSKVRRDVVFDEVGHYVSAVTKLHSDTVSPITYPFAGLMREELKNVEYGAQGITLRSDLVGVNPTRSDLVIPGWQKGEWIELSYKLQVANGKLLVDWEPVYRVNEELGPWLQSSEHLLVQGSELMSAWVQIADNEAKYVTAGGEVVSGRAKLVVGEPIKIEIFEGKGEQELSGWEKVQKQQCGEENKYECWALPLSKSTQASLLQTITHYQPENGLQPEVCLDLEGEPYQCVNVIKSGVSPLVITQKAMKGESYWFDLVVRGKGIEITEPGIVWYPQIGTRIIESGVWEEFENERRFGLPTRQVDLQGETLKVLKVEVGGEVRVYDFGKLGKREIENCDVLGRGEARKTLSSDHSPIVAPAFPAGRQGSELVVEQVTQYIADQRGAGCDYVEMSELKTELPYLMRLKGENVEGRSIKFFLYNTGSERNDLEYLTQPELQSSDHLPIVAPAFPAGRQGSELLETGRRFDQTFVLLPWSWEGYYTLNIETRSFGERAENVIYPVEVRYFPIEQVAGAKIITGEQSSEHLSTIAQGSELGLQITEVNKTGTWLYQVKFKGEGLIKLSQGYDEGWMGIAKVPNSWKFGTLEHMRVNGWSNGWIVDECTPSSNAKCAQSGEPQSVVIMYWPQLLEYLGFGLMGVVVWKVVKKRKH